MNHKELTAHIRKRIKVAGIKALCEMQVSCGHKVIAISVPKYDVSFTDDEQRKIRHIAKCNRLTWVRGMEIDIEQMTDPQAFKFYADAALSRTAGSN